MSPLLVLLLSSAVVIGVLYWFWLRALGDVGPAAMATIASMVAIVVFGVGFMWFLSTIPMD